MNEQILTLPGVYILRISLMVCKGILIYLYSCNLHLVHSDYVYRVPDVTTSTKYEVQTRWETLKRMPDVEIFVPGDNLGEMKISQFGEFVWGRKNRLSGWVFIVYICGESSKSHLKVNIESHKLSNVGISEGRVREVENYQLE